MIQQKITEIAEILGWSVDFSEPQNGKTDVNFAKYTSYGQDFNFSVELEDDDMEAFIDNIHEYYENFDVDEEAYIWIGSDGHGKNGAPYHIADIVKDMEEAEVLCVTPLHVSYGQIGYTIHFPYSRDPMPELAYDWEMDDLTIDEKDWQKWLSPEEDDEEEE